MRKMLLSFGLILSLLIACSTESTIGSEVEVRKMTMQGEYYPADIDSLSNLIDRFADTTTMGTNGMQGYFLHYIGVPHGKMDYTFQNAKDALRAITGYDFETFIFIADCNKDENLSDFNIYSGSGYESMYGTIHTDTVLQNILGKKFPDNFNTEFQNNQKYNRFEPYVNLIGKLVPHKKIVPIIVGKTDNYTIANLAKEINQAIIDTKKNVLTVLVTNLSEGIKHTEAREKDVPLIQTLEEGNSFDLFRRNLKDYDNELKAYRLATALANYGGANMLMPYLYNTSFNVYEQAAEFKNVKAYLSSICYRDPQLAYYAFSPLKSMTDMNEFADSVEASFKLGLKGQNLSNITIVTKAFLKSYPAYFAVWDNGELVASNGNLSGGLNLMYNGKKSAYDAGLNNPKAKELLEKYDKLHIQMLICNFPVLITSFPKEGKFSKVGFGVRTDDKEIAIIPGIDFDPNLPAAEIEKILYQKAGISKEDKHLLFSFSIFILEKNSPNE
jgi:AmmeMemoRadiSam system protein B